MVRILFVGIPDMALVCLDALKNNNKNIVGIVAPAKNHPCFGIMQEKARIYDIPFLTYNTLKESSFIKNIIDLKPDVGVVCSYDRLITKPLLDIPKYGFLNVHPSLLPEYRGGNPYFHVIKNQENITGVTIHFMDEDYDTGDIVSQSTIPVSKMETMGTLFNKLNLQSSYMLVDVINMLEKKKELPRIKQDTKNEYKLAPCINIEKGDTVINWDTSCEEIEAFVRACNPFFITISYYKGETLRLYSVRYEKRKIDAKPGEIVIVASDSFGIAAKDGIVYPEVIYFGSYAISDVKSFIKIFSPKEGEVII